MGFLIKQFAWLKVCYGKKGTFLQGWVLVGGKIDSIFSFARSMISALVLIYIPLSEMMVF